MKTMTTIAERAAAYRPESIRAHAEDGPLSRWAERALRARLTRLRDGAITWIDGQRHDVYGRVTPRCTLQCTVRVHDRRFYGELAFGGSVGAGESFIAGDWSTDDLTALVRILTVNRDLLDSLDGGAARLTDPLRKLLHAAARNTRSGARRNIAAHYDLGNDFFELVLDPTMMYSCAFFDQAGVSLEQAQLAKLDRICRKLDLRSGDHLLEIGTGWGALALHAARHYGCRVTSTTISAQQYRLAVERVQAAGLSDRITIRADDYRELRGRYDKLVSIEMIEAVGHHYVDEFFRRCADLLMPGGTMLLQAITIADQRCAAARDSVDFIKRHIFPGCFIPSVSVLATSIARTPALRMVDLEDIGPHYATTLAAWRQNLNDNADRIRARGYSDQLLRMWQFYLSYCEGGFAERALGTVQIVAQDTSRAVNPPARV